MNILSIRICGHISGAEVYNLNLIKKIGTSKVLRITYITNLADFAQRLSNLGIHAVCIPFFSREVGTKKDLLITFFLLPIYIFLYTINIHNLEIEAKFDLICLQSMTEKIFLTPLLKLFGYKILWIEHGPLFCSTRSNLVKLLYRYVSNFTDKILAVSDGTLRDLANGGVQKRKIIFIPIGIDTSYFSPFGPSKIRNLKNKLGIPCKSLIVTFMGSVTEEKGIKDYINICINLLKEKLDIYLLVIGDGPLLPWAKVQVENFNLSSKATFTGHVEEVKQYLGISDILFFPSKHNEGLSISILEALSMEKLVVASNMAGNLELVQNGKTGLIINNLVFKNVKKIFSKALTGSKQLKEIALKGRQVTRKRYNIIVQSQKIEYLFTNI